MSKIGTRMPTILISNEAARLLLAQAVDYETRAGRLKRCALVATYMPPPGSVVRDHRTGTLGVIKDQQGAKMIDYHTNSGPVPLSHYDMAHYDVLEEPEDA